jgi:hypothetical protein
VLEPKRAVTSVELFGSNKNTFPIINTLMHGPTATGPWTLAVSKSTRAATIFGANYTILGSVIDELGPSAAIDQSGFHVIDFTSPGSEGPSPFYLTPTAIVSSTAGHSTYTPDHLFDNQTTPYANGVNYDSVYIVNASSGFVVIDIGSLKSVHSVNVYQGSTTPIHMDKWPRNWRTFSGINNTGPWIQTGSINLTGNPTAPSFVQIPTSSLTRFVRVEFDTPHVASELYMQMSEMVVNIQSSTSDLITFNSNLPTFPLSSNAIVAGTPFHGSFSYTKLVDKPNDPGNTGEGFYDSVYIINNSSGFVVLDLGTIQAVHSVTAYDDGAAQPEYPGRFPRNWRSYHGESSTGPWIKTGEMNSSAAIGVIKSTQIPVYRLTRFLRIEFDTPHDPSSIYIMINETVVRVFGFTETASPLMMFDTNGATETRLVQTGPADTTFLVAVAGSNITASGFDTFVLNFSYPLTTRLLTGTTPTGPWNVHAEQVLATYPAENQMMRFTFPQTTFRYFKLEFTNADFDFVRMNTFQFFNRNYILYHPQTEVLELFDRNNNTFCVLEGHTTPAKTSFIEVDLGGSINVNRLATRMTTTGYPTTIRMFSGSPGNYTTLVAEQVFSSPPPVGQHPTLDFPDTTMTHVRFELSGVQDDTRVILVKLDLLYIEPLGYALLVAPNKIESPFVRINCFNTQTERETNIELNEMIVYGETIAPVVVAPPVQTLISTHRYLQDSFGVSVRTDQNGHIVKRITAPNPMRRELQRFHLLVDGPTSGNFINTPSGDLAHTYRVSYADKQAGEGDAITTHMADGSNEIRIVVVDDEGNGVNASFSAVLAIDE